MYERRGSLNKHSCLGNNCFSSSYLKFCILTFKVSLLALKALPLHVKYDASR